MFYETPTPDNIIANTGNAFDYFKDVNISQDAPTTVDNFDDFDDFEVSGDAAPITGDSASDSFFNAVDNAAAAQTISIDEDRGRGQPDPTPKSKPQQSGPTYSGMGSIGSGGDGGNNDPGGGGCVIATHAVNSGAFTKDTKKEAVRWCVKNLHRKWWGEAVRKGYKHYGQKAIEQGKAENHYQEFKDYVAFGTGKKRTLKTGWTFVYRTVQFFLKGLTL